MREPALNPPLYSLFLLFQPPFPTIYPFSPTPTPVQSAKWARKNPPHGRVWSDRIRYERVCLTGRSFSDPSGLEVDLQSLSVSVELALYPSVLPK